MSVLPTLKCMSTRQWPLPTILGHRAGFLCKEKNRTDFTSDVMLLHIRISVSLSSADRARKTFPCF